MVSRDVNVIRFHPISFSGLGGNADKNWCRMDGRTTLIITIYLLLFKRESIKQMHRKLFNKGLLRGACTVDNYFFYLRVSIPDCRFLHGQEHRDKHGQKQEHDRGHAHGCIPNRTIITTILATNDTQLSNTVDISLKRKINMHFIYVEG